MTLEELLPSILSDPASVMIFPMGTGHVLHTTATADDKGMLVVMAVPDHLFRGIGPATEDEVLEIARGNGPKCIITFDNELAIGRFIDRLTKLRREMLMIAGRPPEGSVQ